MKVPDFYSIVFLVWFLGSCVFLIQGIPNRVISKDHVRTRKDTESSQPATFDDKIGSPGAPIKYEIISQDFVQKPNVNVFKECDDENECEQGSGENGGDRIPIIKLLPALKKDSRIRVDAFTGDVSNKEKDITYEIISKSTTTKEKRVSGKDCDDEDECGSTDDVFDNDGGGDEIVDGLSPPKTKDVLSGETTYYKVISKSMVDKDEPKLSDVFSAEKGHKNDHGEVQYEIISKSMTNGNKVHPKKDCDDEDDCGSTDDTFRNDDDNDDGNIKGLSLPKQKESIPTDISTKEKASGNEHGEVKYEIISNSMTSGSEIPLKKDCDDEDECGSADDVFSNKGLSPPKDEDSLAEKTAHYEVISKSMMEKDDSTPTDAFSAGESSSNSSNRENAKVTYEIISKSMMNRDEKLSGKDCDDEDECGNADDGFASHGSGDEGIRAPSPPKEQDSASINAFTTEEPFKRSSEKENGDVTYEIISKSMTNGKKAPSKKDCDDEDGCGITGDAFSNDGSGDEITESPTKNKEVPSEKTTYYEVISNTMERKDDSKTTDAFTAEKSSGSSSMKRNRHDDTYEIISQSMENGDKVLPQKNCDDEDECGSGDDVFINDGRGLSPPKDTDVPGKTAHYEVISKSIVEKDDSTPTDTFSSSEKDKEDTYEIISKSMTKEDKAQPNKNCDDEDECGSTDDVFSNDDGSEYKVINSLSPPKHEDVMSEKKTYYEVISKEMVEEEKLPSKECDDDDEDCLLVDGGSGYDTFDARRHLSPPKYQSESQVSVESTVQPLFRGTSYLQLQPLGKDAQDNTEAELEIFPLESTGILLYNGWESNKIGDFISLSIQNGLVELSFDCRSGPIKIRTMESIKMNKWNRIKFFRSGRLGKVTLNDNYSAMGFSPEPRSSLALYNNLMVGGVPEEMQSELKINIGITKGFTGYIRNLKIQSKMVQMQIASVKHNLKKNDCIPSPCENGGQCVENGKDYLCLCKAQYRGRHCKEEINLQPISFHRESYVRFDKAALLKILQGQDGYVTFSILTTQSRGLLLWEVQKLTKHFKKYATVGLKVGFVSLSFNLGTGRRHADSTVPVNDGEWHSVTIERRKGSCALTIDNQHKTKFNSFNNEILMKPGVDLYIGGVPNIKSETQGLHKTGFKGCLKNLKINAKYLDFSRDYIASQGTGYCSDS